MATSKQLTGGTNDVNPQWWSLGQLNQTAPNVQNDNAIIVPINRFPQGRNGKVTVMELLRVVFDLGELDNNLPAAGGLAFISCAVHTRDPGNVAPQWQDPSIIADHERTYRGSFTATGTALAISHDPQEMDLTDGAGHGMLLATDQVFLNMTTGGYTAASFARVKILYRFKTVSLTEYIGIVQSQQ
jgi:hypothetical protein